MRSAKRSEGEAGKQAEARVHLLRLRSRLGAGNLTSSADSRAWVPGQQLSTWLNIAGAASIREFAKKVEEAIWTALWRGLIDRGTILNSPMG